MDDIYTEKMRTAFHEEAEELLGELETSLMELEENPQEKEEIDQVFRALHTLKGSGSMFGFDAIAEFAHEIESVFDLVRNDSLPASRELIDLTLRARDQICRMLAGEDEGEISKQNSELTSQMRKLAAPFMEQEGPPDSPASQAVSDKEPLNKFNCEDSGKPATYRVRFKPPSDIFLHGTDPLLLIEELAGLGESRITAHLRSIPDFNNLNIETCYVFWDIILTTDRGINAVRDIFIFVEDDSEIKIEVIDEEDSKRLGEILVERGDLDEETLKNVLTRQEPIGKMLRDAGLTDSSEIESALAEQKQIRKVKEGQQKLLKANSIRVGSDKLDKLVDMVGELVTVEARFSQKTSDTKNLEYRSMAEEIERISSGLRDLSMSLRMVPIGTTFSRFKRLVRDLSRQLGKKIELATEGGDTELDATIIERLVEPLIHLIRNSIDHGIEGPEERKMGGKQPTGTIHLRSSHSGAFVLIQIEDDGAGLNSEQIRARAIEKGIIRPEAPLSEKEIFKLIFAPGFSTAQEVTGLSGRGVGMDVAKRTIEELGGVIEVESKMGKGTRITLRIPLTLAIIKGLLVRINEAFYVIPLSSVEECFEITRPENHRERDISQTDFRGTLIPYLNLRKIFLLNSKPPEIEHMVIINSESRQTGFLVDQVIGELQTVVKNLGMVYSHVEGISGATILGDGRVALILDVLKLVQIATEIDEEVVKS
jgi:two-component system chemotaxis sensor kinase CheA